MPADRERPARDDETATDPGSDRDPFAGLEHGDESDTGHHRIARDGRREVRENHEAEWEDASTRGRSIGRFLAGIVDGIREKAGTVALLATLGGVGGGAAVNVASDVGKHDAPPAVVSDQRIELLAQSVADMNIKIALLQGAVQGRDAVSDDQIKQLARLAAQVSTLADQIDELKDETHPNP